MEFLRSPPFNLGFVIYDLYLWPVAIVRIAGHLSLLVIVIPVYKTSNVQTPLPDHPNYGFRSVTGRQQPPKGIKGIHPLVASFQHRCSAGWIPACCSDRSETIHPSSGYRGPLPLPSSSLAELEFVGPFLRRREYNTATDGFRVRPAELASWSSWSGVLWREWELAKGRDHARAERFQRTPMTGMTGANKEDSDEVSPLALLRLVGR